MKITLPWPPSANRYWRKTKRGITYVSEEAKRYRTSVALRCCGIKPVADEVTVTLMFFRPTLQGDLDNRIKIPLDALSGFAWVDDKQIAKLTAERFLDRKNPRIEVSVEAYGTAQGGNGRAE